MRWIFADAAERGRTEEAIAEFWRAFQAHRSELDQAFSQGSSFDVVGFMADHLKPIHPALMWEYGPAVGEDGHRLVVTPEARAELSHLTRSVVMSAPELAGWQFYQGRLGEDLTQVTANVAQRTGGDISDMTCTPSRGGGNLIDLTFSSRSSSVEHDAFLATEGLLGEPMLDTWIGSIESTKRGRLSRSDGMPIAELATLVAALQREIRDSLPEHAHHEFLDDSYEVSLLQTQPQAAEDYARMDDRLTWVTPEPAFVQAVLFDRFASERFSRCDEQFAFVKVDGAAGLDGSSFEDRSDIEDVLDSALRAANAGCVYGGGQGLRYSYVDLALTDVHLASEVVTSVLAHGRVPQRTWLQFHDKTWSHEWVGVFDQTPTPPLPQGQ